MPNATTALVFVISINVLMFIAQASIIQTNPEGTLFLTGNDLLIKKFAKSYNYTNPIIASDQIPNNLPTASKDISPETSNIFTDIFATIKNWFSDKIGLSYLYAMAIAPYNLLKIANVPEFFVFAIGTLWYGITLFVIVGFFLGRDV